MGKRTTPYIDKGFEYTDQYGDTEILYPQFEMYQDDDNLALIFHHYEPELEYIDEYGLATVNVYSLPFLHTTIDTNNNSEKLVEFLEKSGFGERTGQMVRSGFCLFPVFKFNEEFLKEIDPDFYERYANAYGKKVEKTESLDKKIKTVKDKFSEQKQINGKSKEKEDERF